MTRLDNLKSEQEPKFSFWERYNEIFNEAVFFPRALEKKILFKWLNPRKKNIILDVGCGPGTYHNILSNQCELYGIDIYKKFLNEANNKYEVGYVLGDAFNLPFMDQTFDKVFSNCVLEHLKNDDVVLSEISRVLKKNGKCILTVDCGEKEHYNFNNFIRLLNDEAKTSYKKYGKNGLVKYLKKKFAVERFYSKSGLEEKLNKVRLEIVDYKYYIKGVNRLLFDWGMCMKYFGFFGRMGRFVSPFIYPIIYLNDQIARGQGYGLAVISRKKN